jgi:hypothetical protein
VSTTNNNTPKKEYDERCCQTGCDGCPYGFETQLDPRIPTEFQREKLNQTENLKLTDEQKKYLELADLD